MEEKQIVFDRPIVFEAKSKEFLAQVDLQSFRGINCNDCGKIGGWTIGQTSQLNIEK